MRHWRIVQWLASALPFVFVFTGCTSATPLGPSARPQPMLAALAYVIGDAETWPRTGTQFQAQLVDREARLVCWVKYARPEMFECWRWDDRWLYHAIDHAIDGDTGESYMLSDGRWLPRTLAGEWS